MGHRGRFGHEFLEFEVRPDGKLRYANNSNYKQETMIRKEGARGAKGRGLWKGAKEHAWFQCMSARLS